MSQGSYWRSQFSFEYVAHEGLKSLRGRSSGSCRVCRKEPHRRALVKQPSKRNGRVHRTCDFRNREFMQRPAPHRLPAHQLQVFFTVSAHHVLETLPVAESASTARSSSSACGA